MNVRISLRVKTALCTAAVVMQLGGPALAAPQGASVAAGNASVAQSGATTTIHASNNAVINYQSFNIAGHETVQFVQPDAASRVLNRVLDGRVTQIDGTLRANGQVYIANPAGIFFGGQSVVSVGGLTAAAGTITDGDFRAGIDRFQQVTGDVAAMGRIEGRMVQLIGRHVANHGTIVAPDGTVTMVAGNDVYLSHGDGTVKVRLEGGRAALETPAVENSGTIDAPRGRVMLGASDVYTLAARNSGQVRGGDVRLTGAGGRVENSGTIDATNAAGKGGHVELLGREVALYSGSLIDVSGSGGGGEALIGGDYRGGNGVATAERTFVDFDAVVRADGLGHGDGGRIIIWADDRTGFYGHVSARGGEAGGNGGFAEVSGKQSLAFRGTADLRAEAGFTGTLLLDPRVIIVNNIGGTVILDSRFFSDNPTGTETFLAADIVDLLASTDLVLEASDTITIDSLIDATGNEAYTGLTLRAGKSIFINADVLLNGFFTAEANAEPQAGIVAGQRSAGVAVFTMAAGTTISTVEGDINIHMGRGDFVPGNTGGLITLRTLDTVDGAIHVQNHGATAGSGITVNGPITAGGEDGEISLKAFLGSSETVTINGAISGDDEIEVESGGNVVFTAAGSITNSGTGYTAVYAGSTSDTAGAIIMADGSTITAQNIELGAVLDITVGRIVSTGGFGNIELHSRLGGIKDGGDTGGADIENLGGRVTLLARSIGTSGNPLEVDTADLTAITRGTGGGDQFINIAGGLSAFYLNAGTGNITVQSGGSLLDTDGTFDIVASTATFGVTGDLGSSANPINTTVTTPAFTVSGSAFFSVVVDNVVITTPINLTNPGQSFVMSTTGTLTVDAGITTSGDNGFISLSSSGNMTLNAPVTTSGEDAGIFLTSGGSINLNSTVSTTGLFNFSTPIRIEAEQDVIFGASALVSAVSGQNISIEADAGLRQTGSAGKILMAEGAVIDGGGAAVSLYADEDITISRVITANDDNEAIDITSRSGAIVSAGIIVVGADLEAVNGGVHLQARTGIGHGYHLETNVGALEMVIINGSGNMEIEQAGDLAVLQAVQFNSPGDIIISSGGTLTLGASDEKFPILLGGGEARFEAADNLAVGNSIVGASVIDLHAGYDGSGDLFFTEPGLILGAGAILLNAGDGFGGAGSGSIVDAAANRPLFSGMVGGTGLESFEMTQDGAIAAGAAPGSQFLGGPGASVLLRSFESSVSLDAEIGNAPNLTIQAATTVNFSAGGTLTSLAITAGSTITHGAAATVTGPDGVNFTTARNIVIDADLTTLDQPITMFANTGDLTSGNFTGIDITGGSIDGGSAVVTLNGHGGDSGAGNVGVRVGAGGSIVADGGFVAIDGVGGQSGPNSHGIFVDGGSVTATGNATLAFNGWALAGTGIVADGADIGGPEFNGSIIFTAGSLSFGAATDVQSTGTVVFQTFSLAESIGVGDTAAGDLLLTGDTLSRLHDGFATIQIIGGSTEVGSASFVDPLLISTTGGGSGLIDILGGLTLDATASLTLITAGVINLPDGLNAPNLSATGSVINLNGNITVAGQASFLSDVVLNSDVVISTASAVFASRINSDAVETPRSLIVNLSGSGAVVFLGTIGAGANDVFDPTPPPSDDRPLSHLETNSASTGQTILGASLGGQIVLVLNGPSAQFNTAAQIANNVEINEVGGGDIAFAGTLNAAPGSNAPALALNTSGGSIMFSSAVGGTGPLGSISTGAGDAVIIGASITTSGPQTYGGPVTLTADVTLSGSTVNLDQSTLNTNGHTLNTVGSAGNVNPASLEATTRGKGEQNAADEADTVSLAPLLLGYGIALPQSLAGAGGPQGLQSAVERYAATQPPGAPFNPAAFAAYLKATPAEADTLLALDDLAKLLAQIDALQLPADEAARLRQRVLRKLAPKGLTPSQLESLLEALGRKAVAAL